MSSVRRWLSTRRGVLVTMLALLVLLDLARSAYARGGYASPVSTWEPDQKVYADIVWPPGSDLPANAPLGQQVYARHCQVCHGPDGRGNGPAAPSLVPRPRDFTAGQFKYKSTAAGQPPSDADLRRTVLEGLNASAMPYWKDLLDDAEIDAVMQYVKDFSPDTFGSGSPQPLTIPEAVTANADSIARGKQLYAEVQCNGCHGDDGRAMVTLKDAKGYPVIARDLTAPWTFRGGSEPEQIWLRLTTGMLPGPMPSFADKLTPEQRWDVVNYVASLARTAPWEAGGTLDGPGENSNLVKRGEYIVHAEMCGLCHTMIDKTGIYRADDFYLAGGMRVGAFPYGMLVSKNLTSDPVTGLGNWTEQQIIDAMRTGRAEGRVLNMYDMPWIYFHTFSDDDARGIAVYLKNRLAPVHNIIPAPLQYGWLETVVNKLTRPLPAIPTTNLTFADGRFGYDGGIGRDLPQGLLVGAQVLVLLAGIGGIVYLTWREGRFPKRVRGWVLLVLGVVGLGLCGFLGSVLYDLPLNTFLPADVIVEGATSGLYQVDATKFSTPEQGALARRGQYLYTVACALCHGTDASGGVKVSWKPMGTLWVRNLTPDTRTGLGQWSDQEIMRAIRSGVSRNGYALHWQGMIWDHASNWDEEDIRALVAYLRVIPAVNKKIPADRPPAPDDCETYTFWTSNNNEYGCK